jgi:hypothetical protein
MVCVIWRIKAFGKLLEESEWKKTREVVDDLLAMNDLSEEFIFIKKPNIIRTNQSKQKNQQWKL